jgi:DNA repair protein RadC
MKYSAKQWKIVALHETPLSTAPFVEAPKEARQYWFNYIASAPDFTSECESLYVLHLNTRKRVTGHHLVAHGLLDTVLCHPREVFRAAIIANCAAILLMHNHPSGDPSPSDGDIKATREIIRAGTLLKIEVIDHVVVGQPTPENRKGYCSLRELGYFYNL